jgi:hypothetical protein
MSPAGSVVVPPYMFDKRHANMRNQLLCRTLTFMASVGFLTPLTED